MSNDYFKAQGWFKNYARSSQDSRGMFQRLVKEDEEAFRLASAESDKIKALINRKFGPGTLKYGSEIPQPPARPEVIEMDLFNSFMKRNPAAEGGQMVKPSIDGSRPGYGGKILPPPDNWEGTQKEWEALDRKQRFRLRNPDDIKKWNLKRKEKGGDWFTADFSKRKFDKSLLDNIEKEIVKENLKTGKTKTLTQLLTDSGVPLRIAKHPSLRENSLIKKATKDFLSLPQKVNNYLENVILNPDTPYDDIKYPIQSIQKKFSTDGVPMSYNSVIKYIEKNPLYKQNKDFLNYLGKGAVNKKYAGTGKTMGDMMYLIDNRVAEPFFAVKGPDDFIMKSAYRSWLEGKQLGTGSSINFIGDPTMQNPSEWMFEYKGNIYAQNSAFDKVDMPGDNRFHNKKINNLRIKNADKKYAKVFGEVYNIFNDLEKYRNTELINPRTNNKSTLDFMTREAYEFERGYPRNRIGIEVDHGKGLKTPFNNLRLMNRELNQTAGNIIRQHGKTNPELAKKMLEEIGYNKPYNFDEFIKSETDRVVNVLNPENFIDGKYTVPEKPSLYSTAYDNVTKNIDYIGGQGGTTLSSGFNTDLLMKDPAVQKILNSKTGQAVKNAARGTAGTVGKVFGVADILIGVLDYENNISKGQKPNEALGNAVQAMSFGLYKSGDRARIADVKERFVAKGGDGEIFDQATALNVKDQEINDLIYKSKFTADKAFMDLSQPQAILGKSLDQRKQDYEILKKSLNEKIAKAMSERDDMIESYKTNLRVSEAGAPIQIGGQEFFSQPFKDIKQSTMEKIEEENKKAYDMQKRQLVPTAGNIGNWILTNVLTMNPQERAQMQKYINEMDERELYRFNLQRGMDPDNLIRFEDILRYKINDPALMGVNPTKYINKRDQKSEGGITGLRSKYEYKK